MRDLMPGYYLVTALVPAVFAGHLKNHVYGLRIVRIRFAPILVARALVFQAAWLLTEEGSRLPRERLQKGLLL
jgi:hypothetical protein